MLRITPVLAVAALLSACAPREDDDRVVRPGDDDDAIGVPGDDDDAMASTGIGLVEIAAGLTSPVALVEDEEGDLWVADRVGTIHRIRADGLDSRPILDLRDRIVEPTPGDNVRGLLGMALHPQFGENGMFYAFYTAPPPENADARYDHLNVLAEFRYDRDADRVTIGRALLGIPNAHQGRSGGSVAFGPDGYLYVALGDGGLDGAAQNLRTLPGSILRLDVDTDGRSVAMPADNPYRESRGRDAIWAYGFRQPSFSFDRDTGALWVADRGQELMEEIDVVEKGGNYGWNVREGFLCFDAQDPTTPLRTCPEIGRYDEPLFDPIVGFLQTPHVDAATGELFDPADAPLTEDYLQLGLAVVGGFVYRGTALQDHVGHYVFATWSNDPAIPSGKLLTLKPAAGGRFDPEPFVLDEVPGRTEVPPDEGGGAPGEERPMFEEGVLPYYVTGLGEGRDGELYVLTSDAAGLRGNGGRVFRLDTVEISPPGVVPD